MINFQFWVPQLVSGLAYGSVYGLFGLSIVLLYRANHVINLATTEISTFVVILMSFILKKNFGYWASFISAMAIAFTIGLVLHFILMGKNSAKVTINRSSEFLTTLGLFYIFNNLSAYFFGEEAERFPLPFKDGLINLKGIEISYQSFFIFFVTGLCVLGVVLFFKFTRLGLLFEAVAEDMTGARLRGVRASYVLAMAWGFNTVLSAAAGVVIAPTLFLSSSMLISVMAYALIGVVIGGLESPLGAWAGGVIVGLVENIGSNIPFFGSELKFLAVFALLLAILVFKPRGFWGKEETRKV